MVEVSTSILSIKEGEEASTFLELEAAKTDYFHIDVMDGKFVEKNTYEKMLEKANYVEELVVVDNNLITSRGPATTMLFAYKLVDILGGDSTFLKEGMLWNKLEEE